MAMDQYDTAAAGQIELALSIKGPNLRFAPSLDFWVRAALHRTMTSDSSDDAIKKALAELLAKRPSSIDEKTAIDAAIVALLRVGAVPPSGPSATERSPLPTSGSATRTPEQNPFYGLGLKDACFKQLAMTRTPQTVKEVWEGLAAAGFQSAHNDPPHAVLNALSRRASKHRDVLLVGEGKWGLKTWYTDDQLEEIKKSVGGMGGRDKAAHGERTKAGMLLAKKRGARIGAAARMTPERWIEVETMIRGGFRIPDIAKHCGVTPALIYQRYNRAALRELRELESPSQDASGLKPRLSVVK